MCKLSGIRILSSRLLLGQKSAQKSISVIINHKNKKRIKLTLSFLNSLWEDNLIQGYSKKNIEDNLIFTIHLKFINSLRVPLIKSILVLKNSKSNKLKKKKLFKNYILKDRKIVYMIHKNNLKKNFNTNV
jgi:hypothetical protein